MNERRAMKELLDVLMLGASDGARRKEMKDIVDKDWSYRESEDGAEGRQYRQLRGSYKFETAKEAADFILHGQSRTPAESVIVRKTRQERWDDLVAEAKDPSVQLFMNDYWEKGYFVMRDVFDEATVQELLEGRELPSDCPSTATEGAADQRPRRRTRLIRDNWFGAKRLIQYNREAGGGLCAVRSKGRYDLRLPSTITGRIDAALMDKGVDTIIHKICPRGKVRTENIMLSAPGSDRQPIHTDSAWDGSAYVDPLPHYLTVLIPLTKQDEQTGGTRVWPGSHRNYSRALEVDKGFEDMVDERLRVGDALIFDGLLSHCGLENKSKSEERYFFYLAFSSKHDPNTELTM